MPPDPQRDAERTAFGEACELPTPAEQAAYLERAARGDTRLQTRLAALLDLRQAANEFFSPEDGGAVIPPDPPAPSEETEPPAPSEAVGGQVGRYRLLDRVGEGAFGRVYRAEQVEPVRRIVALKIIKLGMDTREVIARFEAERQALALMDHPNLSHVFDAGATQTGRPYFVMEYVQGTPITDFCDQHRLSVPQRLELFLPVCHALQHAHQKGIVHRDLKPSNLLVTIQDGRPWPKVIDFGVAKAMQASLTDRPLTTALGQLIGTPAYMSPEQAAGDRCDVDTRADIYSLGVVLYELLCGASPFDPQRLARFLQAGAHQALREEEPAPPSARVRDGGAAQAAAAVARNTTPAGLASQLRGELDWVVMKALEKDRDRRYPTVNALARDLERFLREEPVTAAPPSGLYRLRKFVRRHRQAVGAATAIVFALAGGLVLSTHALFDTRQQRNLAQAAEQRAHAAATRTRQIAYASDLNLVQHALEASNLGRARELLDRHRPEPGQDDPRGWEWYYLEDACRSDALFELGHQGEAVSALAVSADQTRVASAGMDGTVRLWDLTARKLLATRPQAGTALRFAPASPALATAAPTGGATLWSLPDLNPTITWPFAEVLLDLAYSPDGQTLFAFSSTGALCRWDLPQRGKPVIHGGFPAGGRHTGDFALGAQGQWLVLGGSDGLVRLVDPRAGGLLHAWAAHGEALTALALTPDDQRLATAAGFSERTVRLWRLAEGSLERAFEGHQAWISSLAFSPRGELLASASADQTLRVWSLWTELPPQVLRGHQHEVWALAFLADGETLVSGGKDGTLNVWHLRHLATPIGPRDAPLRAPSFAANHNALFGLDAAGGVVRVSRSYPSSQTPRQLEALGVGNRLLASCPHRGWIATADAAGVIRVWDERGPTLIERLETVRDGSANLSRLRFTTTGSHLVAIADARTVHVFATDTWQPAAPPWQTSYGTLAAIDLSPDGQWLAAAGDSVAVFALGTGESVAEFRAHDQPTDAVAFSPDGRWLASGSQEGLAKLWETQHWTPQAVLRGHLLGVHAVAFSPDGRRLATGSVGGEFIKVWDLSTHQELLTLTWPGKLVAELSFSPDGRALAASSSDFRLRWWQAGPPTPQ
ncbi:MAG: hypothetical protein FJ387_22445 [Verrucomicrobia bacterium]|nr:hypothetical protein [Verrucomicrobiota bacterium]